MVPSLLFLGTVIGPIPFFYQWWWESSAFLCEKDERWKTDKLSTFALIIEVIVTACIHSKSPFYQQPSPPASHSSLVSSRFSVHLWLHISPVKPTKFLEFNISQPLFITIPITSPQICPFFLFLVTTSYPPNYKIRRFVNCHWPLLILTVLSLSITKFLFLTPESSPIHLQLL